MYMYVYIYIYIYIYKYSYIYVYFYIYIIIIIIIYIYEHDAPRGARAGRARDQVPFLRHQVPVQPHQVQGPPHKNNHFTDMCSVSEAGSYLRLIDSCITQLEAQAPYRACNESQEEEEKLPAAHARSCRGTSLIKKRSLLGPYSRPMPKALWLSWGVGVFF